MFLAFFVAHLMEEGSDDREEEDSSAACCMPRRWCSVSLHLHLPSRIGGSGSLGQTILSNFEYGALSYLFILLSNTTVQLYS